MRIRLGVLALLLVLSTPTLAVEAQQGDTTRRIGILSAGFPSGSANRLALLRASLRELGHIEGKNVVIELRWAEGKYERLPALAADLVRLKVDVLVTPGTPATLAAKAVTTTIPIVMVNAGDAVATGLVASLARPGGNVTGTTILSPELMAKRVELLKEAVPNTRHIAVLVNPVNPAQRLSSRATETAARALNVSLQQFELRGPSELDGVFSAIARQHVRAVVVAVDSLLGDNARAITDLAAKRGIASVGNKEFAEAGGLIGYGISLVETYRRAASLLDKILKGAGPANLAVEQPTKFELVVNLKTAKTLGLTLPPSFIRRADEIIE